MASPARNRALRAAARGRIDAEAVVGVLDALVGDAVLACDAD
jgi:hypothetical protein